MLRQNYEIGLVMQLHNFFTYRCIFIMSDLRPFLGRFGLPYLPDLQVINQKTTPEPQTSHHISSSDNLPLDMWLKMRGQGPEKNSWGSRIPDFCHRSLQQKFDLCWLLFRKWGARCWQGLYKAKDTVDQQLSQHSGCAKQKKTTATFCVLDGHKVIGKSTVSKMKSDSHQELENNALGKIPPLFILLTWK